MRGSFEPASRVHTISGQSTQQNVDDTNDSNKRILLHFSVTNTDGAAMHSVTLQDAGGTINITVNVPANGSVPNMICAAGLLYKGQLTVTPNHAALNVLVGIA